MKLKHIELDEFRERMTDYLYGRTPLAVERDGEILGFYYPKNKTKEKELKRAVKQLELAVDLALAETGMTEDELADLFDLSKPFPYDKHNS